MSRGWRPVVVLAALIFLFPTLSFSSTSPPVFASQDSFDSCEFDYDSLIGSDPDAFRTYHNYSMLTSRLHELEDSFRPYFGIENNNPDLPFEPTWESRETWAITVTSSLEDDSRPKSRALLVGGHHGNEWTSMEMPMYLLHIIERSLEIVGGVGDRDNDGDGSWNEDPFDGIDNDGDGEDDDNDPNTPATWDGVDNDCDGEIDEGIDEDWNEHWIVGLLDHYEIMIVPLVNPDGFEHDRSLDDAPWDSSEPGWPKNRRNNSGSPCFGVDLDRNYAWWSGPWMREPFDDYHCWASYEGPFDSIDSDDDGRINEDPWDGVDNDRDGLVDEDRGFGLSEPETRNMWALMSDLQPEIAIDFHSSDQQIRYPWSFTYSPIENESFPERAEVLATFSKSESSQASEPFGYGGSFVDQAWGAHGITTFQFHIGTKLHEHPAWLEPTLRRNMAATIAAIRMADPEIDVSMDQDGDGVTDEIDWCPETASGSGVGEIGCDLVPEIQASRKAARGILTGAVVIVSIVVFAGSLRRPRREYDNETGQHFWPLSWMAVAGPSETL